MGAVTLHAQMEDTPHNGSGLLVDQPVVLILRVLPVAVDRMVGGGLASVSSGLIRRALFPAAIPQKPFVSQPYIKNDITAVQWRSITSGETV